MSEGESVSDGGLSEITTETETAEILAGFQANTIAWVDEAVSDEIAKDAAKNATDSLDPETAELQGAEVKDGKLKVYVAGELEADDDG